MKILMHVFLPVNVYLHAQFLCKNTGFIYILNTCIYFISVINEWKTAGKPVYELLEPVDGFHANQVRNCSKFEFKLNVVKGLAKLFNLFNIMVI
jgi:hypothetical protein